MSMLASNNKPKIDNACQIFKVSAKTPIPFLSGAMASIVKEGSDRIELHVIGAGAINQAIKSIAVARSMIAANGKSLAATPSFFDTTVNDRPLTAMKLTVIVLSL